jgi:hypothetical protein
MKNHITYEDVPPEQSEVLGTIDGYAANLVKVKKDSINKTVSAIYQIEVPYNIITVGCSSTTH